MGRLLILLGVLIAAAGVLVVWGVPLGRLPGDLVFKRGNVSVYVPITTSVLVSLLLTLLMALAGRR